MRVVETLRREVLRAHDEAPPQGDADADDERQPGEVEHGLEQHVEESVRAKSPNQRRMSS